LPGSHLYFGNIKRAIYRWAAEQKEIVGGSEVEDIGVENPESYHFIMSIIMGIIF
jgi:hypothetical protein